LWDGVNARREMAGTAGKGGHGMVRTVFACPYKNIVLSIPPAF
jgi:hypothetical protein